MRLRKLTESIPAEIDGFIINSECNLKYYTGFSCDSGLLLVTRGLNVFFTDSRYIEQAQATIQNCRVENSAKLHELMPAYCRVLAVRKLAGESDSMTASQTNRIRAFIGSASIVFDEIYDYIINAMRRVKNDEEIALIKRAQAVAENAFSFITGYIKQGMTEREIRLELDYYMLRNGADELSFDTIAVSGCNSSKPHGVPSGKRIEAGDFITLDFGAVCGGYHSDMTRTVAVGYCTDEQREIYGIVLNAQEAALAALKPGITGKAADAAARDVIKAAGYGECFGHGTGHGVGLRIHESPTLNPKAEEKLMPGNIVTVEPGIYLPGKFGVRIEDMALITDDGYINLTHSPKKLITIS